MNKIKCVADTSALLSLEATNKIEKITRFFTLIAPSRVKEELSEISQTADKLGNIAKRISNLQIIEFIVLEKELQSDKGEIEVISLANKIAPDYIIMDDIKAKKKLQAQTNIQIKFSPFIIFYLYQIKVLTYNESQLALEKMRIKREWKENLIIDYAKRLFDENKE